MQKQVDYIVKTLDEIKVNNSEEHHAIIEHQKKTNGKVMLNSEFRLRNEELLLKLRTMCDEITMFKGGLNTVKWLVGFVGVSNVVLLVYSLIR
jgi:hypothetical protein